MSNLRLRAGVVTALLCAALLCGCAAGAASHGATDEAAKADGKGIKVVCATFPALDWVRQVLGDRADACEVTYLMGSGVDLHSYQPTVGDVATIADADLFVYVGGESDAWAADAVEAAGNPGLRSVSMLEAIGDAAVREELVEGMQEEAHDHEGEAHDHEGTDAGHDETDVGTDAGTDDDHDEHVWLSLRNAQAIVGVLAGELSAIDPEGAATYAANAEAYQAALAELDGRFAQAVAAADKDTVVFADRFPFRYLVDDYGLGYFAAFPGCSAETEASFETVSFLARKVDELGLSGVLVIEGSDQRMARTVIESTQSRDQAIVVMDSMQAVDDADVAEGASYLAVMEANLAALVSVLA